jgi:hypothetical protein
MSNFAWNTNINQPKDKKPMNWDWIHDLTNKVNTTFGNMNTGSNLKVKPANNWWEPSIGVYASAPPSPAPQVYQDRPPGPIGGLPPRPTPKNTTEEERDLRSGKDASAAATGGGSSATTPSLGLAPGERLTMKGNALLSSLSGQYPNTAEGRAMLMNRIREVGGVTTAEPIHRMESFNVFGERPEPIPVSPEQINYAKHTTYGPAGPAITPTRSPSYSSGLSSIHSMTPSGSAMPSTLDKIPKFDWDHTDPAGIKGTDLTDSPLMYQRNMPRYQYLMGWGL